MKPSFFHTLVNGPFEDPSLYIRFLRERRALMFDLGSLGRLSAGDLLKITDVFVSHAHIDHFIGFDTLLRAVLRRPRPLRVFGPADMPDCVEGKLKGYTWNLIKEYPVQIEAFGISENAVSHASFHASECFKRIDRGQMPFDGAVLKEETFRIRAVNLTHDIQCLAYAIEEDFHINIDKAALSRMALPVGPWLGRLKQAIREGADDETEFEIEGKDYRLGELKGLAMITKGQKVSYIVDASPTEENIKKAAHLARDSDTLYCEAYFLDEDSERARHRNHLTARLAGAIAREARAGSLVVMHFSPKYKRTPHAPVEEAMGEFKRLV